MKKKHLNPMKTFISFLAAIFLCLGLLPASAQFGKPGGSGPDNALTKVFGTNLNFSATMNMAVKMSGAAENEVTLSSKIYFAKGNSRTEMNLATMQGSKLPPHAADQMKAMGMDQMISISRPDTKTTYLIYPGLNSYAQITAPKADQGTNDSKVTTTELGKETVDGHPCVKNKYTITNARAGENVVLTTWNATDLKNYPIKIEMESPDAAPGKPAPVTTLHFTNINTAQPAASLFEPPVGYRVYTDVQAMVQTEMMKKMNGGGAVVLPPGHP
jgi:hypothetical protein